MKPIRVVCFLIMNVFATVLSQSNATCECVPYHQCDSAGYIITDGSGSIDQRFGLVKCDDPIATCCKIPPYFTQQPAYNPFPNDPCTPNHYEPNTPAPQQPYPITPKPQTTPYDTTPQPPTPNPFPTPGEDTIIPEPGCGVQRVRGSVARIIDGSDPGDTFFGELPWMVALLVGEQSPYMFKCGGSLIHPQIVLTAAHCVKNVDTSSLIIRAGEWDSQSIEEPIDHQDRRVARVISHPNFNPNNLWYDIALVSTNTPFEINLNVDTICLPPAGFSFDNAKCIVSGWGKDAFGQGSAEGTYRSILRKVEVPVVPRDQCQALFRKTRLGRYFLLHESFVCAGGEHGKDACQGDGGGPLICPLPQDESRWAQIGVVSWGIGCGVTSDPGAYTSVPLLVEWIVTQIMIVVPSTSMLQ